MTLAPNIVDFAIWAVLAIALFLALGPKIVDWFLDLEDGAAPWWDETTHGRSVLGIPERTQNPTHGGKR